MEIPESAFGEFLCTPSETMKMRPKTCSECLYAHILHPCRKPCRGEYRNDPRWLKKEDT